MIRDKDGHIQCVGRSIFTFYVPSSGDVTMDGDHRYGHYLPPPPDQYY